MIEYFSPELKATIRKSSAPVQYLAKKQMMHKIWKERVFSFDKHIRVCKEYDKSVYVADIANTPNYMLLRSILEWGYVLVPNVLLGQVLGALVPELMIKKPDQLYQMLMLFIVFGASSMTAVKRIIPSTVRTDQMNTYERFILHAEDARRLFLAKATQELTRNIQNEKGNDRQLIIFYPEAHIDRVIKYIHNPNKIKDSLYRLLLAPLDFTTRKYRPDPNNQELSGWSVSD